MQWKAADAFRLKAGYRWIAVRRDDLWENRNQVVSSLNFYF